MQSATPTDIEPDTDEQLEARLAGQREQWQREIDEQLASLPTVIQPEPSAAPDTVPPPYVPERQRKGFDPARPMEWWIRGAPHLVIEQNRVVMEALRENQSPVYGRGYQPEPELAELDHTALTTAFNEGPGSDEYAALVMVRERRSGVRQKHADRRAALEAAKADPLAPDAAELINDLSIDETIEANIERHWLDAECQAYDRYVKAFQAFARDRETHVIVALRDRRDALGNEIAIAISDLLDRLVNVGRSLNRARTMVPSAIVPVGIEGRPVPKADGWTAPEAPIINTLQVEDYNRNLQAVMQ